MTICSPQLGIAPESNSGGEVYDREVIKALCKQGVKVVVILPLGKPYPKIDNLKVYYLPFPFIWPPFIFNFLIIPYLFYIYWKHKFNILRVHSPYFVGLGALVFRFFYPKIFMSATYHHLEEKKIYSLANCFFMKQWDWIITDSKASQKDFAENCFFDRRKMKVISPGVNKRFKPKKRNKNLIQKYQLENKKVILFLGGLKRRKNLGFLLELISKIEYHQSKVLIAGSGSLQNRMEQQAERLNIVDKIIFCGFIAEKEKVDYYNLADIFVFPSRKEGFGMPVIEAGACGVPCIASNVYSLKEIIVDGETGFLAELNNISDWKRKMEKLLKNDKLRQRMGENARNFSKNFSWEKCAEKQLKIYHENFISL